MINFTIFHRNFGFLSDQLHRIGVPHVMPLMPRGSKERGRVAPTPWSWASSISWMDPWLKILGNGS